MSGLIACRQPGLRIPGTPRKLDIVRQGLVAEYRFDAGSGQWLVDYSGNGNHGQLGSTPLSDVNDPSWTAQGLSFVAASSQYVDCGAFPTLGLGSFSVDLVVNSTSVAQFPLTNASGISMSGFGFVAGGSLAIPGTYQFRVNDGTHGQVSVNSSVVILGYVHVTGVVDRVTNMIYLYINGNLIGSISLTGINLSLAGSQNICFGKRGITYYTGQDNYCMIYNYLALTAAQVRQNHQALKQILIPRGIFLS